MPLEYSDLAKGGKACIVAGCTSCIFLVRPYRSPYLCFLNDMKAVCHNCERDDGCTHGPGRGMYKTYDSNGLEIGRQRCPGKPTWCRLMIATVTLVSEDAG